MSELADKFNQATVDVKTLTEKPSNENLLKLYSNYKQATDGDVSGKRPGFTNIAGRAKYDSWASLKGQSADKSMENYIDLVQSLLK
jgi:acyl-CoA-binding protein